MTNLEKRFKIVALAIIGNPEIEKAIGSEKIEITADAIDCKAPVAEDMVNFLEHYLLRCADELVNANQN